MDARHADSSRALAPTRLAALSRFPSHAGSDRAFDVPHAAPSTPPTRERSISNTPRDDGKRSFCVVSGGTGANALVDAFTTLGETVFVMPVSDNGGSSSELIRVMGGPSLGDIRSRLVRLIPPAPPDTPEAAIKSLLEYRLPSAGSDDELRAMWSAIVEGKSTLWRGVRWPRRRRTDVADPAGSSRGAALLPLVLGGRATEARPQTLPVPLRFDREHHALRRVALHPEHRVGHLPALEHHAGLAKHASTALHPHQQRGHDRCRAGPSASIATV